MPAADNPTDALHLLTGLRLAPSTVAALESAPHGPFRVTQAATVDEFARLLDAGPADLVMVPAAQDDAPAASAWLGGAVAAEFEAAVLFVADAPEPPALRSWLRDGVQEVFALEELRAPALAVRLRCAFERQCRVREARLAYATDLGTGLPHQQQLMEHMSQLMALREREPAPMALIALRIEGLAGAQARLGLEAAAALRRKVAVRLRAGVRASDVVASLSDDHFAVMLGSMLTPADAHRVAEKLLKALWQPFKVAGQDVTLATAIGIGQHPQDGAQPEPLLRRALALAAAIQAQGRGGHSVVGASGASLTDAANDD
jgi:diguanylate cyclase (GGDEF)-like protein